MKNRKEEQEAIRTTIVGGRPPGCGQPVGEIPYGIEILVKKAAVDAEFKKLLLSEREKAADTIGLELNPSEIMMLKAVTEEQLKVIIDETEVKPEHKSSLLGKVAAVMIAALGFSVTACSETPPMCGGIRPPDLKEVTDDKVIKKRTKLPSDLKLDTIICGIRSDHSLLEKLEKIIPPIKKKLTDEADSKKLTSEATAEKNDIDNAIYNNPDAQQNDINMINFDGDMNIIDNTEAVSRGIRPDRPSMTKGIRPDRPFFPPKVDKDK